jgi:DNA-binding MurR/RpiR family transcriptional regulator
MPARQRPVRAVDDPGSATGAAPADDPTAPASRARSRGRGGPHHSQATFAGGIDAVPPVPTIDLHARVRAVSRDLSPAERRVAELISAHPHRAAQLTVGELARQAATSAATVVRAAKSLGFGGYPQLRLALAAALARQPEDSVGVPLVADVAAGDSMAVILAKLAAFEREQLLATAQLTDPDELEQVALVLSRARRCCVFGVGASGLVATDLVQKITRIDLTASARLDQDAALVAASLLTSDDLAIAVSHSGESPGAVQPLRLAASRGASTAAITGAARSSLAAVADHVLLTAGREFGRRSAAVGSRTSQLLLVDALFVRVTQLAPGASRALQLTHDAVAATRPGTP